MPTLLGSGIASASPGQLALSAALAALCAGLGYRMSSRHRALRGVTPWRLPSLAWAVLCLFLLFVGLAIEVLAELTTRSPYSPAAPAPGPDERTSRFAPPSTPPVAVEPPGTGERPGALLPPADRERREVADDAAPAAEPWPAPPTDDAGRPALFGWYADPAGRHERRYFDGRRWSEHVVDGTTLGVDPL